MAIKKGDKVKVWYEGKLENGAVFDSSERHSKPLEIEVGKSQVIKGFEEALIGMEKDQEKEVTIKPKDAYGPYNPKLLKKILKKQIPPDKNARPGVLVGLMTQDGRKILATVKSVTDKEVFIDLNHPLTGKTLIFKLKIVEISS